MLLAAGAVLAARLGYLEVARDRLWGKSPHLSAGDFPPGVSAPIDAVASLPNRPTLVGLVPQGGTAPLLAAGKGAFFKQYAMELKSVPYASEGELRSALLRGAEHGGVDFAAFSVPSLAFNWQRLFDASPKTVALLSKSRGQEVLVAAHASAVSGLKGLRLACEPDSTSRYFALWTLSRAGLAVRELKWVDLKGPFEAGAALKEGRADAVVGGAGALDPLAKEQGWNVLASTADAPHLLATVLVVRGDYAARFPDAVRRVLRGALEANQQANKDPLETARLLGDADPGLGDPNEAMKRAVLATTKENLAFFSLSGESPVTYSEQFGSAAQLAVKLGLYGVQPNVEETQDLSSLRFISTRTGL